MPTLGLRCAALAMSSALASACMSAPCNQARATFVTTPLPFVLNSYWFYLLVAGLSRVLERQKQVAAQQKADAAAAELQKAESERQKAESRKHR